MTEESTTRNKIAYVGPAGAGFGFELSGMDVRVAQTGEEMIVHVQSLIKDGAFAIIFIDEALAKDELEKVGKLNEAPLPAILLLPNPTNPENVAATNLKNLLIKAIGSDVFGGK